MVKPKRLLSFIVVGALAVVGICGAFVYRSVSAQAPTPTPTAPATQGGTALPAQPGRGKGMWGNIQGTNPDQQLADVLGITLDKLQAAETTANADALKEAVTKGLLTQAQADQLSANAANRPHFGGRGDFDHFGANSGIDYNALLAKALGITTDQLRTAQQKVQDDTLAAAVTSGAMTQAQADLIKARQALANNPAFQTNLKSAYEAALKQAVTDGVITQAQADALIKEQASAPGFPGFGPGRGFEGGFGGPGGRGHGGPGFPNNGTNQNNPANPTPTAPSSSN